MAATAERITEQHKGLEFTDSISGHSSGSPCHELDPGWERVLETKDLSPKELAIYNRGYVDGLKIGVETAQELVRNDLSPGFAATQEFSPDQLQKMTPKLRDRVAPPPDVFRQRLGKMLRDITESLDVLSLITQRHALTTPVRVHESGRTIIDIPPRIN